MIVCPGTSASVDALVIFGRIINPKADIIVTLKRFEVLQQEAEGGGGVAQCKEGKDKLKRKTKKELIMSHERNLEKSVINSNML